VFPIIAGHNDLPVKAIVLVPTVIDDFQGTAAQIKNDVCYDLSGKGRPTEFKSTAGSKQFLVTYQGEKR
jgi:hypothetical protein